MKSKLSKIIFYFTGFLLCLLIIALIYVKTGLPNVGDAPAITLDTSKAVIQRGEYLANNVAVCMDCHSSRDWTKYAGPIKKGGLGGGGEVFSQELGFPGRYVAKNITPYHLASWTDGEIYRAIACGVSKDGSALFPIMPHPNFGKVEKKDILAIISYLRTLAPVKKDNAASVSDFPMNFIINTIPKPAQHDLEANKGNGVLYGQYVFTMASCGDCHTKQEKGAPIPGMELAGGFEFKFPDGSIARSANITPDINTGIGRWTKETFVNKFKSYRDSSALVDLAPGQVNTVMPWAMYAGMTDEDLSALFDYLRTVKPIGNKVQKFSAAK